jgi:hypothetical protein
MINKDLFVKTSLEDFLNPPKEEKRGIVIPSPNFWDYESVQVNVQTSAKHGPEMEVSCIVDSTIYLNKEGDTIEIKTQNQRIITKIIITELESWKQQEPFIMDYDTSTPEKEPVFGNYLEKEKHLDRYQKIKRYSDDLISRVETRIVDLKGNLVKESQTPGLSHENAVFSNFLNTDIPEGLELYEGAEWGELSGNVINTVKRITDTKVFIESSGVKNNGHMDRSTVVDIKTGKLEVLEMNVGFNMGGVPGSLKMKMKF